MVSDLHLIAEMRITPLQLLHSLLHLLRLLRHRRNSLLQILVREGGTQFLHFCFSLQQPFLTISQPRELLLQGRRLRRQRVNLVVHLLQLLIAHTWELVLVRKVDLALSVLLLNDFSSACENSRRASLLRQLGQNPNHIGLLHLFVQVIENGLCIEGLVLLIQVL